MAFCKVFPDNIVVNWRQSTVMWTLPQVLTSIIYQLMQNMLQT